MSDPHYLGQTIASLRRAHGWSQRKLGQVAGVSPSYIAQLELGRLPTPSKLRLDAVAHALELRTSDALLTPPSPPQPLSPTPASINVVASVEQLRPVGARPLPVFRLASCGDPRARE